jgi:hypothetical protein
MAARWQTSELPGGADVVLADVAVGAEHLVVAR